MASREQTQHLLGAAIGDKYDVMQWIGGGGMAGVYLARHRLHGGFCAVKVLAEHLSEDPGIVEQFHQEARTAANLDGHPNVVRIVDIGENQGLHYLIMQYVEGEDLATYLQRAGRLTPAETVYAGGQIADALRWAHSKGVIHRDLKPANARLDMQGRVIVLDFGIAKIGSTPTALTQMGFKVGTPYYMAPEHIRGQPIDNRADLYALGVMMYEMVIGKRPFGGETNEAIWHAHVSMPPPVPHEVDPAVPQPLSHIILHLLQKDPDQRYQSADKLLEHLKTLGIAEAPPSLRPRPTHNMDELRAASNSAPTPSLRPGGWSPPGQPTPTPRPGTAVPGAAGSSAAVSSTAVSGAAVSGAAVPGAAAAPQGFEQQPGGPPKRRLLPLFAGLAAMLAIALGVTLYFAFRPQPAPPPPAPEPPPVSKLPDIVETPVGAMRLIRAGEFVFGANNDVELPIARPEGFETPNPRQTLALGDYYMDVTEVPNSAYKQFCDATSRPYPQAPYFDKTYFDTKPGYPVVGITFDDAEAFAAWAGKRLPTEQEWEKAARGADARIYPWGNSLPTRNANTGGGTDGFEHPAPVTHAPEGASPYGLLNMSGNVWEWTASLYQPSSREIQQRVDAWKQVGVTWKSGAPWFVIKGGDFDTPADDLYLMLFFRAANPSDVPMPYGFRCAMDPPRH
jgi:serine/threonine-protein kinase